MNESKKIVRSCREGGGHMRQVCVDFDDDSR